MIFHIYRHTNTLNGKCYIGMTRRSPRERFAQCFREALKGHAKPFHNALRAYGRDPWITETLHEVQSLEEACALEILEIARHKSLAPNGYNATTGGDGSYDVSASTREKISLLHKGRPKRESSLAQRRGETHIQSKIYIVTYPDGHEEEIVGLTDFCRKRGLDYKKAHETTWNPGRKCCGYRFRLSGADAVAFEPRPRGPRLTPAQRQEIGFLALRGDVTVRELVVRFGVSDATIYKLKRDAMRAAHSTITD